MKCTMCSNLVVKKILGVSILTVVMIVFLASSGGAVTVKDIKSDEDVFAYVKRTQGAFDQTLYQQVVGAANAFNRSGFNNACVIEQKLQFDAVTAKGIFTMTFVGGAFNRTVVAWKLAVLNDDLAVTLHPVITHACDPRAHDLPPRSARNSPIR